MGQRILPPIHKKSGKSRKLTVRKSKQLLEKLTRVRKVSKLQNLNIVAKRGFGLATTGGLIFIKETNKPKIVFKMPPEKLIKDGKLDEEKVEELKNVQKDLIEKGLIKPQRGKQRKIVIPVSKKIILFPEEESTAYLCRDIEGFSHRFKIINRIADSYLFRCEFCGLLCIHSYHLKPFRNFLEFFNKMESGNYYTLMGLSRLLKTDHRTLRKILDLLNNNLDALGIQTTNKTTLIYKKM